MSKIKRIEDQQTEFKESWRDDFLKYVCGFANAQGGIIFIGVRDDGEIIGIANAKRMLEDIPNKIAMTMGLVVDINIFREFEKEYISIRVKPSVSPIAFKGKFYYRSGSTLQELTGIALEDFLLSRNHHTWDSLIIENTSMDDINPEAVEYFIRRGIRFGRLPKSMLGLSHKRVLSNLKLINDDGLLTNAALLLFGKDIIKYFVGAAFRIGRFLSNEADLLYQDEVKTCLILMPDAIMDLLKGKYLISHIRYEGLQRIEQLDVPEEALRELICNSVAHRDYRGVHTQMKVYNDHIRLWNEGGLIDGMTTKSLREEHNSRPRNQLIAQIFFLAGLIEAWGRGIWRVDKAFGEAGLILPTFEESCGGFMLHIPLHNQKTSPQLTPQRTPQLTPQLKSLLFTLKQQKMTIGELVQKLNLKDRKNFKIRYLRPAIEAGWVISLYPDIHNHPKQQYFLSEEGLSILNTIALDNNHPHSAN